MKAFKSERAAKMAMTKAEKAYVEALGVAGRAYRDAMGMPGVDPIEYWREKEALRDQPYKAALAVYEQAKSQGFWVRSWHFGYNPTRDLIAANID